MDLEPPSARFDVDNESQRFGHRNHSSVEEDEPYSTGNRHNMSDRISLPFFLGATKSDVVQSFGESPDTGMGECRGNYRDSGVTVAYDSQFRVCRIWLRFADDRSLPVFSVLGVALGDNVNQHLAEFGEPKKIVTYNWSTIYIWCRDNYWLKIETWPEDGDEEPWGPYRNGDLSEIEVSYDVPHAYVDDASD